jgi:hypothetical protein
VEECIGTRMPQQANEEAASRIAYQSYERFPTLGGYDLALYHEAALENKQQLLAEMWVRPLLAADVEQRILMRLPEALTLSQAQSGTTECGGYQNPA